MDEDGVFTIDYVFFFSMVMFSYLEAKSSADGGLG